ncbi:MAG: S41 family peptidase [Parvularcula sp.]
MTKSAALRQFALTAFLAIGLVACGGGGSTAPRPFVPPSGGTTSSEPVWTPGFYPAASTFKDRCQVPRSGVDIEGNPFPDILGSLLREKFWLRSWTHETYLWNNEVVDQDPASFGSRTDYFAVLRTTAVTPSGKDKDDFHFSEPTVDFLARRNSSGSASYGMRLVALQTAPPRDYRVGYTEDGTPAAALVGGTPAMLRGTRILEVDGVDLVNGGTTDAELDILNAGLFPANPGESHTFLVQDDGAASTRTVTLVSADLAQQPVHRTGIINTATGPVGYIHFTTFSPFSSEQEIVNAISQMQAQGISDLVLDLRYNGGGLLAVASQLAYMVAGPAATGGQTFELLRFNADAGNRNPVTGDVNDPIPFYSTGLGFSVANGAPLPSLNKSRVFILTTSRTCSASEAVINGLRGVDIEVVLIGGTTCGKPFGFYPQDNCGETYYTIQFQGVNDKGFGDYADGFIPANSPDPFGVTAPGCTVADDFSAALGDENEGLLAAALQYRADGTCPALPPPAQVSPPPPSASGPEIIPPANILSVNRDMRMPEDPQ